MPMLNRILNTNHNFKKLPHNVQKITMKPDGSKFAIQVHCRDMPVIIIGRYDSREEAHRAMVQLSELTKSEIIK